MPCQVVNMFYPSTVYKEGNINIPNLRKHIEKCQINISTTLNGIILPVCIIKMQPTISTFTHTNIYSVSQQLQVHRAGLRSVDGWCFSHQHYQCDCFFFSYFFSFFFSFTFKSLCLFHLQLRFIRTFLFPSAITCTILKHLIRK